MKRSIKREQHNAGFRLIIGALACLLVALLVLQQTASWAASTNRTLASQDSFAARLDNAATTGSAQPQDIGTSHKSDRLAIDIAGAPAPPAQRSLQAYLLTDATQSGRRCGPLQVNGNGLHHNCDVPGVNLIAAYDSIQIMQEASAFSVTLPSSTLAPLRTALVKATDTPSQVGYAVGLMQQGRILYDHSNFAKNAADANKLIDAKIHAEHVLNILYGLNDPRYGDQDGDGAIGNPGDKYGLITYAKNLSTTLQLIADNPDATDNMLTRVDQVHTTLGNLGSGDNDGNWFALFIEKAELVLAATNQSEAQAAATQLVGFANRIYNGVELNDNGEIEPIAGEGGVITAHRYTQYIAEYLAANGTVRYGNSSNALKNDQLVIKLSSLTTPFSGEAIWAYLLLDDGSFRPVGSTSATGTTLDATITVAGTDLLAEARGVYLSVGVQYAQGALPVAPLGLLRNVMAQAAGTPGSVGYAIGLATQGKLLFDHANFAKTAADANKLTEARMHAEHVLNLLYGTADPRYGDHDGDGAATNPGDGYGLLRYAKNISTTLQLVADHADATANMKTRVAEVRTTLGNLGNSETDGRWFVSLIEKAELLLAATNQSDTQTAATQLVGFANRIYNGVELNDNGQIEPIDGEGGVVTAYRYSQHVGDYTLELLVTPVATPTPTATVTRTPTPTATTGTGPTLTPTATATNNGSTQNGDGFEADDQCAAAKTIATDGLTQSHTFHQQGDNDWISFQVEQGKKYQIEARVPPGSPADLLMEVYGDCSGAAETAQDFSFSPDIRLNVQAAKTGSYYLRLLNHTSTVFGSNVAYQLSVRGEQEGGGPGALIVVAGRLLETDKLQDRIYAVTDRVYRLWRNNGYGPERIRYLAPDLNRDADGDGVKDVAALPSKANLQDAIVNWAADKLSADRPLTIYVMDHGAYDKLYLDEPRGERLFPDDMNSWLSQLEAAVPDVKINVIIEACNSGSFIDPDKSISGTNRVVVTSASAFSLAWASPQGAVFSDALLDSLAMGQSLYVAFDEAKANALRLHSDQFAWLDDNGDGAPNGGQDGKKAAIRGFNTDNSLAEIKWKPYVVEAEVLDATTQERFGPQVRLGARGEIRAEVRDNSQVKTVLATIYPPSFRAPTSGEELVQGPPPITLQDRGNNIYAGLYGAFDEIGTYRIVVTGIDDDGLESRILDFTVSTGSLIYLPLVAQ
ncbi:MAG: C13 family peptidase [Caldilineaceae bacterium]